MFPVHSAKPCSDHSTVLVLGFTVHRRRHVPLSHKHPERFRNNETRQPARYGQNHSQVVEASQRLNDGPRRTRSATLISQLPSLAGHAIPR